MKPISIIIAILNFLLLVYVILGSKIKTLFQWLFPKKITLRIGTRNYTLNCFSKKLVVMESLKYYEMENTSLRTRRYGGRLYLQTSVRSIDITKEIQEAFYSGKEIKFIDSAQTKYDTTIVHLSKDGIRTYLTLVGVKRLEIGRIPEESILDIKPIFKENELPDLIGQAMLDLSDDKWRKIYREKIARIKE